MGQMTVGILYGCEAPDDDEEKLDIIADGFSSTSIRVETEGGRTLIGVWVAVGGSGKDDVPFFVGAAMRVDDLRTVYADSIGSAKKLWHEFAKWVAEKHQIEMPPATLWITPCEVA